MTLPVDTNLDFQSVNKPINLPTPVNPGDAAPKSYVDAAAQGIIYKQEVIAASTANVSITAPGSSLDGVTLATGNRILLKNQTTGSQNGIWVFQGSAASLTRPTDFNTGATEEGGTAVFVESGTANANTLWAMNNTSNVTVDTTVQTWAEVGAPSALTFSAPLTQSGNTVSLNNGNPLPIANGGTGGGTPSAARAALGAVAKYSTIIGDGTTTSFTVTHNLGVAPIQVQVFDMATGNWELAQFTITSVNALTVAFGTAPAANSGSVPGSGAGKMVVVMG